MKLILIVVTLLLAWGAEAKCQQVDETDWYYETFSSDGKTCARIVATPKTIPETPKYGGDLVVPSTLSGYPVTQIGENAFNDCRGLRTVVIPSSVVSIESGAFYNCMFMTSVVIPSSVTNIGAGAFHACGSLTSVEIPEGVTLIGYGAFSNCGGLTAVTIPKSVRSIGDGAFGNCFGLTSVTILEGVEVIGPDAFSECNELATVTIPKSVTSVARGAFSECRKLSSVNISDLFDWCGIEFGTQDSNPLYYAHKLYQSGKEIIYLDIPEGVEEIKKYVFF